jgi:DNA-binding transcriptional LysR family regulator
MSALDSGLTAFVRAAETRSYVAAGRMLGLSSSAVGKSVARLEERLGVRLFHRTTRSIRLTVEGQLFFERCRRILAELDDAQAELARTKGAPRGRLRVSLPAIGYRFLAPELPRFTRDFPEVQLDLDYSDRLVDVVEEGFDAVIRSGPLSDSGLKAKRIGDFRFLVVGAPATVKRKHPGALLFRMPATGKIQPWDLETGTVSHLRPAMICNSVEALVAAAVRGMGLAYVPDFAIRLELAKGELVTTMTPGSEGTFRVIWPEGRLLSPKVRAFTAFVTTQLLRP